VTSYPIKLKKKLKQGNIHLLTLLIALVSDPFIVHFETDLEEEIIEELSGCKSCNKEEIKVYTWNAL
jgi:hypothetical protein